MVRGGWEDTERGMGEELILLDLLLLMMRILVEVSEMLLKALMTFIRHEPLGPLHRALSNLALLIADFLLGHVSEAKLAHLARFGDCFGFALAFPHLFSLWLIML